MSRGRVSRAHLHSPEEVVHLRVRQGDIWNDILVKYTIHQRFAFVAVRAAVFHAIARLGPDAGDVLISLLSYLQ